MFFPLYSFVNSHFLAMNMYFFCTWKNNTPHMPLTKLTKRILITLILPKPWATHLKRSWACFFRDKIHKLNYLSVFQTEIMHVKCFSTWPRMNMQYMLMLFIPINPGLIAMANRTYQGIGKSRSTTLISTIHSPFML